jgi:cytochrome P450
MGELLGQCVGLVSHSKWQNLRSILETPFLHTQTGTYIEKMKHRTRKHFEALHIKSQLDKGILNPVEDLKLLPFWIVAEILYGSLPTDMHQTLERLIPLRESLFRRVIGGGITRFWWSRFLPVAAVKDLASFKAAWSNFNDLAHKVALQNGSQVPITNFYEAMEHGSIKREELLQTLDEILFANLDVTMGGISWVLMFLAAHSTCQAELRQEIINHTSETGDGMQHNYLLSDSTLLATSILESSRLKPLAAFSIPQAAPTDRILGDFVIPAGTNFIVDSYALNTHNSYWGDDSIAYRPTRFLERSASRSRYNFWRFGFGPRNCMGKYVADLMMRVLFAHIVRNYELSLISGKTTWDRNGATWITHPDTVLKCDSLGN